MVHGRDIRPGPRPLHELPGSGRDRGGAVGMSTSGTFEGPLSAPDRVVAHVKLVAPANHISDKLLKALN